MGPYKDLFIYLFSGRVSDEDERRLGEHFLGNWVEDETSFLFFSVPAPHIVSELLAKRPDLGFIEDHHFTYEQWQGSGLKPMVIEDFVILPPWEVSDRYKEERRIIMDPGMVFGTGLHPTTRDCLRAMVYLHRKSPFGRVLDLGTGTGILALAAVRLGAKQVLAVDLNPLSVKTAQRNVCLNQLEETIKVIQADAEDYACEPADLVVANIHYEVIAKLLVEKALLEKNWLVISGLMRSNVPEVKSRLEAFPVKIIREWGHDMTWYTLLVKCLK
jgi:ribosomal protein L11 methyltransferase